MNGYVRVPGWRGAAATAGYSGASLRILAFALLLATAAAAQRPDPEVHGMFDGDKMYTVMSAEDAQNHIAAIHDPRIWTAAEADTAMAPDEPVLGVVVEGEARTYSLWYLDGHEIVNDAIGGKAIATTW